jgi:hypothetical protein
MGVAGYVKNSTRRTTGLTHRAEHKMSSSRPGWRNQAMDSGAAKAFFHEIIWHRKAKKC